MLVVVGVDRCRCRCRMGDRDVEGRLRRLVGEITAADDRATWAMRLRTHWWEDDPGIVRNPPDIHTLCSSPAVGCAPFYFPLLRVYGTGGQEGGKICHYGKWGEKGMQTGRDGRESDNLGDSHRNKDSHRKRQTCLHFHITRQIPHWSPLPPDEDDKILTG